MNTMEEEIFRFKLRGRTIVIIDWANVYGWFQHLGWEIDPQKLYQYLKSYPEVSPINLYFGVEVGNKKSEDFQTLIKQIGYMPITKEVKWVPVSLEKSHFRELVKKLFDVLDGIKNTNSEIAAKLYELREKVEKRLSERKPDFDSDGSVQGEYPPYAPEDEKIYTSTYELIEESDSKLKELNINIEAFQKQLSTPIKRRKCDFDVEIALDVLVNQQDFDGLILFSGDGDYKALCEYLLDHNKQVIVVHPFGVRGREYNELLKRPTNKPYLCAVEKLTPFLKL
mgnify:CR=1 FL=1